ncbi:MAG: type II toxin-antitoxin system VapC family toxin [Sandarakinorhabdus sp.]
MILVDSSVWIDWFRGMPTPAADRLHALLGQADLLVGDIILTEVLQGFATDTDFAKARAALAQFPVVAIATPDVAIAAAQNFRALRHRGITVRKTIDTLIATRCMADNLALLYSDRDFDPFVAHLGLVPA